MRAYLQLIRFDKPIGTLLLLWPTLWALFIAAHGRPPIYVLLVFSCCVFLTRSAGCAINDYADVMIDAQVARTKNRPLVRGALSRQEALVACLILSAAAAVLAISFLKAATILLSIPAVLLLASYPWTKRFFQLPQAYLGVAFSFGIVMGFVEIQGRVNLDMLVLFVANIAWVFGYDTIYALVDQHDDVRAGIYTSAITLNNKVPLAVKFCYGLFILLMALIGVMAKLGVFYWLSLIIATTLLVMQLIIVTNKIERLYFKMFLLNNWVGCIVFVGIVLAQIHTHGWG